MSTPHSPGRPPVEFTFDGVPKATDEPKLPAGVILERFGGLDPASYDLHRVVGKGHEESFADEEIVELVPHGVYVSFFTGAMPVE